MAYIGKEPLTSFVSLKRQDITGDGTASYTLDYKVASVNDILVYVNHVKQDPSSMTVSGTSLTMGGNVASTDDFYVIFLGQALQTVTPGDSTITTAMLQDDAVTAAKATGFGKIAQVVSTTKTDTFTTTSSMVDITGLSVNITPSSTSSKILVLSAVNGSQEVGVTRGYLILKRDSTDIFIGTDLGSRFGGSGSFSSVAGSIASATVSTCFLDSPSTTSQITYKWQGGNKGNPGSFYINRTEDDGNDSTQIRLASSITVMEILA